MIIASIEFFFFQAEDGIRDHCVTGVQTCALPISRDDPREEGNAFERGMPDLPTNTGVSVGQEAHHDCRVRRSEERRGGKEWKARFADEHGRERWERSAARLGRLENGCRSTEGIDE